MGAMNKERWGWLMSPVVAAAVIGVSLVAGTLITAGTIDYVKTFNTSLLTVVGTAKAIVTSDQVKWDASFTVGTTLPELEAGYARMDRDEGLVRAFLEKNGVAARDITFSPVSMQQNFVDCRFNPRACGPYGSISYQLTQAVRVESTHVRRVTAVAGAVTPLIKEGVVFSTQDLKYYYTKLTSLRTRLLAQATRDALGQAEHITAATGSRVGRLVSVTAEPFQLTPLDSTQVSNGGQYDTTTITKKLTAIVQATFRLP